MGVFVMQSKVTLTFRKINQRAFYKTIFKAVSSDILKIQEIKEVAAPSAPPLNKPMQLLLNITYMICGSHLFGTASFIAHHLLQDSLATKITGNFKFLQYLFIYFLFIYLFIYLYSLKLSIFDLQPATCKLHPP